MGERGPQPDPTQAAKGFPGRRRSRAERVAEEAARVAQLLAPVAGVAALPSMLQDPKYAPAAAVWRKLAPELERTHRLPKESEFFFVQLCVYAQEWVEATEDLHARGFAQQVKTVAGGKMERRRPKTLDRQQAYTNCLELAGRFGLTPHDMYALFKDQANAASRNPGLFGAREQPPQREPEGNGQSGRIGGFAALKSEPPADRMN